MSDLISVALPASVRENWGSSSGIFIGLNRFDDSEISPLRFAVDDAVDLAYLFVVDLALIKPERTALLLAGEPVKTESRERLLQLAKLGCYQELPNQLAIYQVSEKLGKEADSRGLLLVFASTRGQDVAGRALLAVAGSLQRRIDQTGLMLDALMEDLARSPAGRKLIFLDLWRERPQEPSETRDSLNESFLHSLGRAHGCTVLTAAARGGVSYDDERSGNGLFAGALIDGLSGDAPVDERGEVTVEKLASHVHQQLRNWVAKERSRELAIPAGILAKFEPEAVRQLPLARPVRRPIDVVDEQVNRALANLLCRLGPASPLFLRVLEAFRGSLTHRHVKLLEELRGFDGTRRACRMLENGLAEFAAAKKAPDAVPAPSPAPVASPVSAAVPAAAPSKTPGHSRESRPPRPTSNMPFSETGEDAFGAWALLRVGSAVQRMRWIEPGSFWMGGPIASQKKNDDSFFQWPRHEVQITHGFWLADTPCTQIFWKQSISQNPSVLKSPQRPVENMSWNRVQVFLKSIELRFPGIEVMLPTEAQWEYSCRAGTETSTYAGDLQILGERNAPLLDSIAWYAGNSGVDFDLPVGYDSRQWKEKQYPHIQGGTREVATKEPNSWGLYDMLGNIMEWCRDGADFARSHQLGKQIDPCVEHGPYRVVRGGSCYHEAKFNQAHFRYFQKPASASSFVGFRFLISAN